MTTTASSWLQNLCNLNFFRSTDLRKTSLNRSSPSPLLHLNPVEMNPHRKLSQQSTRSSRHESKKEPDTAVKTEKEKVSITEKDFRIMQIVRAGKNWKTYMVRKEGDQTLYAMKLIGKKRMAKNSVTDQVTMEKEVLEKAKHCFIPKLAWYFENDKKVFLVSEFIEGPGTLSKVLKQLSRFSEEITRFYSAEILLTIEYLHKELQVAHGDVKLRNFLLDSQGHIKMIDLSQAKKLPAQDMVNASGAREPSGEELVDFWGLGCLIYEFLTGKRPFCDDCDDKESDFEEMSPVSKLVWPCNVSKNAKDLISRLINRTVEERPSFTSIEEIKKHAFFAQVNWEKMANKSVYPPLDPAQFKDKPKEDEDLDDDETINLEEIRPKGSKPSSLERIMEGSSLYNSDEDFDAVSYDRTTCINSVLGYR